MATQKKREPKSLQDWFSILPQLLRAGQGETILNLLPSAIHEINNALNTILGFCDLLQTEPSISKTLKEDLKTIERAGIRVRELLGSLRALANGVPTQTQPTLVDLQELCEEARILMAAAFRRNYIKLVTEYSPQTPTIISDAARIRFVLLALFQNACDAIAQTGKGGEIVVRTGRDESGKAFVSIENEGAPISPEARPKIFEPFVTTKPAGKGAGLGLFLVYHFVKELQGEVEVQDTGAGTKVTVSFPSLQFQNR
ncbi:MAG: sensor histidine kinase [Candidatus Fervidibacter sp.]|uniref:sensor histidine kinase n=1 Tax=Candidatus Fervidibacter sp. TaxID=3100871 RepID=UPI00404A635E